MSDSMLITNARLVNEGEIHEADLLIRNGRIAAIATDLDAPVGAGVFDANGLLLLPGMIDDQVHFREPGLTYKADMATESRAALAGGITSFMDMPNTNPQTVTIEVLEDKYALAQGRAWGNHAFYFGGTNDNLDEIRGLRPDQTCGIKLFMGASTGNMLVDDEETLRGIFSDAPMLIATHCEDTPMIKANEERYRAEYGDQIPMRFHPLIRSAEACYKSSSLAIELASAYDARLHVLHLTTAKELEQFEAMPLGDKRITAEACVHHLYFDDSAYERRDTFIKCNPAIKTEQDKLAIHQALADGRIDVIGTDHAPHTLKEKLSPSYFKAPAGLPLVQHALPMALELYHDEVLSLAQVVEKTAHAPAELFGIVDRGYLREGYWADLVLVDIDSRVRVEREAVLYKCGWSPLEGEVLRSEVIATWVNGQPVYAHGRFSGAPEGMRLAFRR